VDFRGKALTLAFLTVFRPAGYTAADRPERSVSSAVVSVSAEDLVAKPVGANWTSYNGDYSG
jgi:hypothetical protein